jgi:hypothetical protein
MTNISEIRAVCLPSTALTADIGFSPRRLWMRMESIYPADTVAVFSGHGLQVRLDQNQIGRAGHLRILTDDAVSDARQLSSAGGTVGRRTKPSAAAMPITDHAFVVRRVISPMGYWPRGHAAI